MVVAAWTPSEIKQNRAFVIGKGEKLKRKRGVQRGNNC